jgi:hypothetical protein
MQKNMGITDKLIRIFVAIVIVSLFLTNIISGIIGIILLILVGIFILTSIISFCPLYTLIGINTCKKDK